MSIWDSYKRFNFGPITAPWKAIGGALNPSAPYKKAQTEEEAALDRFRQSLQPYQQAGIGEIPRLQEATGNLLDPTKLEDQWTAAYQQSPYLKQLLGESREAGLGAASSQGLLGSSAATENVQRSATGLGEQFRSQYLDDLMKKYLAGVETSRNIYGTGADIARTGAAGELQGGEDLAKILYGRASAPGTLFGSIAGPLAGAGIGAIAGGPMGASIGSQIGSRIGGSFNQQPQYPGGQQYGY